MKAKKVAVIMLVIGLGLFGYSQFASATQIGVVVTESQLVESNDKGSIYNVQLEFDNPSLLILNAGETDFVITIEDEEVANGVLEPFVLPSMSKVTVDGTYLASDQSQSSNENTPEVKITGVTKYDVLFASINVPFIYFPPEEQAREFIHQN